MFLLRLRVRDDRVLSAQARRDIDEMAVVSVRVRMADDDLSARLDLAVSGRLKVVPGVPVIALAAAVQALYRRTGKAT